MLAVIPAVVNAALMVAWLIAVVWWTPSVIDAQWPQATGIPRTVLIVILGAITFGVGAIAVYAVAGLIGGPFWERMSEQIESEVTGRDAPQPPYGRVAGLAWSGAHTAASFGLWVVVSMPLLLFGLIPVVGPIVQFFAEFGLTALFIARELLDPATTRRNLGYDAKWQLVRSHRDPMLGLGGVATLALAIPLIQFIAVPVGVAAATLWLLDLEAGSDVPTS